MGKRIPIKEATSVGWDIAKAGVAGGIGAVALGTPGALGGLLVGGLMAKNQTAKLAISGIAITGLVLAFNGIIQQVISGTGGEE